MTYALGYLVNHCRYGVVTIPDHVASHQSLWDSVGMPFPAIREDGQVVDILLSETDA